MKEKRAATPGGSGGEGAARLTPADVQQKEFRISFRGYNERDVDEFLDQVTEELQRYETELMRLRSERAAFDPASFDLDAEQQRILGEANDRADAIVREAEARAAGIPTAPAKDTRAVVAPYLNREREFLQSLGALVQDHAQMIKTMVGEARRRSESIDRQRVGTEPADRTMNPDVAATTDPGPLDADSAGATTDAASERDVVVIGGDEPVAASTERSAEEPQPEGARSLRELFWGED